VKRGLQQPLDVSVRRRRLVAQPLEQRADGHVHLAGRAHACDEADRARRLGGELVIEQRQLFRARQADQPSQPEDRAVRDDAVARGSEADDGVGGGQAQIAGDGQLQAAADGVAVQDRDGDFGRILEPVERANPVPIERLVDGAAGERRAIHPRAEAAAGTTHDDRERARVAGGPLDALGERRRERGIERVEHRGSIESEPAHTIARLVDDGSGRARI
jgi:hypothetical protein